MCARVALKEEGLTETETQTQTRLKTIWKCLEDSGSNLANLFLPANVNLKTF